ncbi:MAG: M4 family peptidase [Paludibacteraceae bacterium]|nr:M4 family peptidase [Paludibacteraceae bacterium]
MKKIVLLGWTLFAFSIAGANEAGHFFVDLSSQSIAVSHISNSFSTYVDVAQGSTFTLFRDTTDALGIRHQSYQQYYQGQKVQSHMVLVHSQNGIVRNMNGAVMTNSSVPQSAPPRISRRQAAAKAQVQVHDSTISAIIICLDGKFYNVYKVPSPKTYETLYVDAISGEVIYRESAIRNAEVMGRAYTRYSGWQDMSVSEKGGKYFLIDSARNMITLSAEFVSPNTEYYLSESYLMNTLPTDILENYDNLSPDERQEITYQYVMGPMMKDYITNSCVTLYSDTSDFYTHRIQSVTISSADSAWWYETGNHRLDLYCRICDAAGNELHKSNIKRNPTFPVTFKMSSGIAVTKGCVIYICDKENSSVSYGDSIVVTSVSSGTEKWSQKNTSGSFQLIDGPIEYADIHWGMQKTLDFYKSAFQRNSFDGNGHAVINMAFPPFDDKYFVTMPNNAAAQCSFEPFFMVYGRGDGYTMNPLAALDVIAHEYTHMVTETNGNGGLEYIGESGALNESFSDLIAMGVMQYTYGKCPWTIGADVMVSYPNMRSMSNPKNSKGANGVESRGAQPDTYYGLCWKPTAKPSYQNDQGGVHTNSGIQNYWFYLLSEGGSGTNDNNRAYDVTGIGIDKAIQVAFRNLIFYLVPCATFLDARNGASQAATDLYGNDSQERKSVIRAWCAVGVGEQDDDISCKTLPYTQSFTSAKNDFIVRNVNLPDGITSVWNWDAQNGMVAKCTRYSAYASESWLISPCIEIPADGNTLMTFSHAAKSFEDTMQMTLWVSSDYDLGYPLSATWTQCVIPTYPQGTDWNWCESGEIDLSAYKGRYVNIALKYTSNTNYAPQWGVKDISIYCIKQVEEPSPDPQKTTKIVRDGQFLILRDGKIYSFTGQELK